MSMGKGMRSSSLVVADAIGTAVAAVTAKMAEEFDAKLKVQAGEIAELKAEIAALKRLRAVA
jgi:hypothetical protein